MIITSLLVTYVLLMTNMSEIKQNLPISVKHHVNMCNFFLNFEKYRYVCGAPIGSGTSARKMRTSRL